jgi:hypothetical protein
MQPRIVGNWLNTKRNTGIEEVRTLFQIFLKGEETLVQRNYATWEEWAQHWIGMELRENAYGGREKSPHIGIVQSYALAARKNGVVLSFISPIDGKEHGAYRQIPRHLRPKKSSN